MSHAPRFTQLGSGGIENQPRGSGPRALAGEYGRQGGRRLNRAFLHLRLCEEVVMQTENIL